VILPNGDPLAFEIKAFGEFQAGIRDRCDEPPVAQAFTEVGSYRFLTG